MSSGASALVGRNIILGEFGPDVDLVSADLTKVRLRPGQVLNEPGDEIRNIYFLAEGLVSRFAVFGNGHEVECMLAGRNTAIGAIAAIGVGSALTRDVAVFDAHAWAVPSKKLEQACRRSPRIARAIEHACQTQMNYAIRIGACNALHPIEQRLSRWLLSSSALIQRRELALGQEVFAKVLGVQRSSVNGMLQRFQSDGLIELGRSRVTIVDRDGLKRRACECYAALDLRLPEPAGRTDGRCAG